MPAGSIAAAAPTDAARRATGRRRAGRTGCSSATTRFFALFVLGLLLAILLALSFAAVPALEKFGFGFFVTNVWNPVTKQLRRAGADLRHAGHVGDRAPDRRAGQLRHRAVPDRDVPASRSSGRWAPRSSCWRRSRRSSTACGACSCSRRSSATTSSRRLTAHVRRPVDPRSAVPGRAQRHRHAVGRLHPVDHGDSVHRRR